MCQKAWKSCPVPKLPWSAFYNKNTDYSMNFVVNLFTTSVSLLNQVLNSEIQTSELAKCLMYFSCGRS